MPDILSFTVDKFTFTVAPDRLYDPAGLWVQERDGWLVVGITDYLQQRSGDIAFVEMAATGTVVRAGERLGNVETIKADVELASPVSGTLVEVNETLELAAEIVNQAPYGAGWLAVIEPVAWAAERATLLAPPAYYEHSRARALAEAGQR